MASAIPATDMVDALRDRLRDATIEDIFDEGLHEFITGFLSDIAELGGQIEQDYRFYG